jgi:uncharacterized membrane protein YkvA (DUF1232 family)
MSKKKPMTTAEKGLHIILSWGLVAGAIFYIFNTMDIIPGTTPLGLLDDAVVTIILVVMARKVYTRIKRRGKDAYSGIKSYFTKNDLISIMASRSFWYMIILGGTAYAYFTWTWDFIPDTIGPVGFFDDAIAIINNLILAYKHFENKGGRR